MDGDAAPLREIAALKEKHGAWLMVDEAHATGLYGKNRRGRAEESGVSNQIEIQMGTLGKAVGASGGYICGSRPLIDFLVNRARSFIFSTAPVPAAAAAATAGIRIIQSRGQKRGANSGVHSRGDELESQIIFGDRQDSSRRLQARSFQSSLATKPKPSKLRRSCASRAFLFRRFVIRPSRAAGHVCV